MVQDALLASPLMWGHGVTGSLMPTCSSQVLGKSYLPSGSSFQKVLESASSQKNERCVPAALLIKPELELGRAGLVSQSGFRCDSFGSKATSQIHKCVLAREQRKIRAGKQLRHDELVSGVVFENGTFLLRVDSLEKSDAAFFCFFFNSLTF